MMTEADYTQPTDRHPVLAKHLWQILKLERFQEIIATRPYLPESYRKNRRVPDNRRNILDLFDQGLMATVIRLGQTDYYHILRTVEHVPAFKIYLSSIKYFRLTRILSGKNLDPKEVFARHRDRPREYRFGTLNDCDMDTIMPLPEFRIYDQGILCLFDQSLPRLLSGLRQTRYYRIQRQKRKKGVIATLRWIYKYHRLYAGIKKGGYRPAPDLGRIAGPWLFKAPGIAMRLDGHHRAAIARHLNHKTIPALIITPADIRSHAGQDPAADQVISYLERTGNTDVCGSPC